MTPAPSNIVGRSLIIFGLMVSVAISVARIDRATPLSVRAPDIEAMLPDKFGQWSRIPLSDVVLPAEAELGPGEAVAFRAYKDLADRTVTLVVAYGPPLGDSVRLHRPESCYVAQGFSINYRTVEAETFAGHAINLVRLATENTIRKEAVTYWLRDGANYVASASGHGVLDLQRGADMGADGALVRVSSSGEGAPAFDLQAKFLRDFAEALDGPARRLLFTPDGQGRASS